MGDLLQFRPRSNPKADRAFWIGPPPIAQMAAEILRDDAFKPAWEPIGPNAVYHYASDQILTYDTAPCELCGQDCGDCA